MTTCEECGVELTSAEEHTQHDSGCDAIDDPREYTQCYCFGVVCETCCLVCQRDSSSSKL